MAKKNNANKNKKPVNRIAPVSNPELRKVMAEIKENNSNETQIRMNELMREARLLIPCDFDSLPKPGEPFRPRNVRFFMLNTPDGKSFFPVFTDLETFQANKMMSEKTPNTMARTVKELDDMVSKNPSCAGILINPGLEGVIVPANLLGLLSGRIHIVPKVQVQPEYPVAYQEPQVYPTRLATAVYECCTDLPDVSRVWLKLKIQNGTSYILIVEADSKDNAILDKIRDTAVPLAKDMPVETVFVTDQLMKNAIGESYPLYDRELEI